LLKSGEALRKKSSELIVDRKQSSEGNDEPEASIETNTSTPKKEQAGIEEKKSPEEKIESLEDIGKSPEQEKGSNEEEAKVEIKEEPSKTPLTVVTKVKDPKAMIKQEFALLKEVIKTLKTFSIDWILEWAKTKNFKYWLNQHEKIIGERSTNSQFARNHIWLLDNGDIYFGDLKSGRRHGMLKISFTCVEFIRKRTICLEKFQVNLQRRMGQGYYNWRRKSSINWKWRLPL